MSKNPTLKKNLIHEALIEIRFKSNESDDFSLVLGALNQKLKTKYPIHESLDVPDFGKSAPDELNYMVRSRLYSEDKKNLYSLGNGVLSVNTLSYTSFENFLKQIIEVLNKHKKLSNLEQITRIGMRYINKVEFENTPEDVTNIKFDLPKKIEEKQNGFNFQNLSRIGADSLRVQYSQKTNSKELSLDYDYFFAGEKKYKIDELKKWMEKAHDNIYDTFIQCLNKKFYNTLK